MSQRAQPDSSAQPADFAPALSRAVRNLRQQHTEDLVRQVPADIARHTTIAVSPATIAEDISLWLCVLARDMPASMMDTAFESRAAAHKGAGLSTEGSLILHHACVEVLHRALVGPLPHTHSREALEAVFLSTALHALRVANAVVLRAQPRQEVVGRPRSTAAHELFPAPSAAALPAPPRWCLVAFRPAGGREDALRQFRTDNPHATIAVTDTHVTAFTRQQPLSATVLAPYALAPVPDGDTAGAARQAALAAVIARHYGRTVDAQHVLPLIAALDLTAEDRNAFVTARLGSLHTDPRRRYLQQTLAAYLAHNQCSAAAARSLYIHRHTLTYRLRSIRLHTGLDLSCPLDRLQAELALMLSDADALFARPCKRTV
ncbi:PucR family transcriptional regulator [Streptomyces longisporoflavus]|uniref:PucR family transcriptional regulator n=1 Tax=Streptomyces longisporoflavus TaxID=28044 RepID=A0ABW7R0H4_9ACTN